MPPQKSVPGRKKNSRCEQIEEPEGTVFAPLEFDLQITC